MQFIDEGACVVVQHVDDLLSGMRLTGSVGPTTPICFYSSSSNWDRFATFPRQRNLGELRGVVIRQL